MSLVEREVKEKEEKKDIKVSVETWRKLQRIKIDHGYKTIEDIIKDLLKKCFGEQ